MKKLVAFLAFLMMAAMAMANPVTRELARRVADFCYASNSMTKSTSMTLRDEFSNSFNGLTTYYVFNYQSGGFVIVAADDAVTPILAESSTGYFDAAINNPDVKYWFDGYNRQISEIVTAKYSNSQTLKEWNGIKANTTKRSTNVVDPLLKTTWDQGCFYNALCPTDTKATSSCSHTWTGCVATTMSQLVKYYSFPAHGYLSHSYAHPTYGMQTASFAATSYNWAAMPNNVNTANANVAALMFQAGVSVDMHYGARASGAFSQDVLWSLVNYFNYDPSTIALKAKSTYTSAQWSDLLKAELDAHRPIYYAGNDDSTGHAWVCDGYNAAGKFHMNWGWSGVANGYYTIGALNPTGYMPNLNNSVIIGIKPGNPNLVVRITNMKNNTTLFADAPTPINVSVVDGTATSVKLFIDNHEIYSSVLPVFTYMWSTTGTNVGVHILKVVAMSATDTVAFPITISVNGWIKQNSSFTKVSRGIQYMHAVDSLVVWASAIDASNAGSTTNEFTRTINGGNTWTPGQVLGGTTYGIGNICGINGNIAFVTLYSTGAAQDVNCGVYKTIDGGVTWKHLTGALQGALSFADNVWFWNENEGMCHGDVSAKDNSFEIYTTSNGGITWSRVPKANIGAGNDPLAKEGGWTSVVQAVGTSTIMFGTNKSNLYISHDKGHTWSISNTGIIAGANGGINQIAFKDEMNGLVAQTTGTNTPVTVKETHDGGLTWQTVNATGFLTGNLAFVKGSANTYVCTGFTGAAYTYDGGHTWQAFKGTELTHYFATTWVNNHIGWAGGSNLSSTDGGIYKFNGILIPTAPLPLPGNVQTAMTGTDVILSWEIPNTASPVIGYNVYRDGLLLTSAPVVVLFYQDLSLPKINHTYCVSAVYDLGVSAQVCTEATLGIGEIDHTGQKVKMYPNPAKGELNINSDFPISSVKMMNAAGQVVYSNEASVESARIITTAFKPGIYLVLIQTKEGLTSRKISIE